MAHSLTTPKRAFGKLFNAIAIAAALCATSAQADVLNFEEPIAEPLVYSGDVLTFGNFHVEAINEAFFAGMVSTNAGFVGPQNPVNNNTTYYSGLNDGYIVISKTDDSAFKIKRFDASFVGAGLTSYPAVAAILFIAGFNSDGFVAEKAFALNGPIGGSFNFARYDMGTFSNFEFTEVLVASYACDPVLGCTRDTNQSQFALDNFVTFVPEPGSFALLGLGLLGLGAVSRRRAA